MSVSKKRTLTVYYGYHGRSYKRHPVIRLAGKYLSLLDFKVGDKIEITLEPNLILINKLQQEQIKA
jgi:hypothetical protein